MATALGVIFGGVGLLLLTGPAFIAYRHPVGYRRLLAYLRPPAAYLSLAFVAFYLGKVYFGVLGLEHDVRAEHGSSPDSFASSVERLGSDVRAVGAFVLAAGVLTFYLWSLAQLPRFLRLEDRDAPPPMQV
jgi:hypothetical protein